jgi:hypothetical protein
MSEVEREIARQMGEIDWADLMDASEKSSQLLNDLADQPDVMFDLMDRAIATPELSAMAENYDLLRKVVLLDHPASGRRLSMHIFRGGNFDRPHNHRWTYTSRILAGRYNHVIFDSVTKWDDGADVTSLLPQLSQALRPGMSYTLGSQMIHMAQASQDTLTIILRGPSVSREFYVGDLHTGDVWKQVGRAHEDPEEVRKKKMTADDLRQFADEARMLFDLERTWKARVSA